MDSRARRAHDVRMWKMVMVVALGGCELYDGADPAPADAAPMVEPLTCTSAVLAECGPRPARPVEAGPTSPGPTELEMARWVHDIDIWAVCAESAAPVLR